jgi:hypothetical protein
VKKRGICGNKEGDVKIKCKTVVKTRKTVVEENASSSRGT